MATTGVRFCFHDTKTRVKMLSVKSTLSINCTSACLVWLHIRNLNSYPRACSPSCQGVQYQPGWRSPTENTLELNNYHKRALSATVSQSLSVP
jgi:hypothetical protein